ncbi:hypothetical protein V6N13_062120 [Hibiscus sabdariffa]|uniref:Uncharacterized protein n=2 Tax=Hibiscus sabdariffa TaxID=183260 RepID=A0ABR2NAD5_9ROSI
MAFSGKNWSLPLVFFMLLLTWGDCVVLKIVNKLSQGTDLKVHCESGDDDLGKKTISFGKSWEFEFIPNIWRTTLYFCRFSWQGVSKRFDVYDAFKHDACRGVCEWRVSRQGLCTNPYGLEPHRFYCYPWQ